MSDSLIADHPKMQEWQKVVDAVDKAERASKERVESVMVPYWEKHAAWEEESRHAVLEGREPPPEPAAPEISAADRDATHTFMARRAQLRQERRELLAAIAPEILDTAAAYEAKTLARCAKQGHVANLPDVTKDLNDVIDDVRQALSALDPRASLPSKVNAGDVALAALEGRSLLGREVQKVETPKGVVERVVDPVHVGIEGAVAIPRREPGPLSKPKFEPVSDRGKEL